ncbi:MAG TPA: hypothetical protein VNN73_06055 [Blastocatellia bacterium]|nr:hypothetical protein [Blastocatellia bacterium]
MKVFHHRADMLRTGLLREDCGGQKRNHNFVMADEGKPSPASGHGPSHNVRQRARST